MDNSLAKNDPYQSQPSTEPSLDNLERLWAYLKPHIAWLVGSFAILLFNTALTMILPLVVRYLVDDVLLKQDLALLNQLVMALLAVFLVQSVLDFADHMILAYVGERVVANIRIDVYRQLQLLSLKFYDDHYTGEITSRLTNDINLLQEIVSSGLVQFLIQLLTAVAGAVLLFVLDWRLTLIVLALIPVVLFVMFALGSRISKLSQTVQNYMAQTINVLEETIVGIRVVKSFARQPYEIARFTQKVDRTVQAAIRQAFNLSLLGSLIGFIAFTSVAIALWLGSQEITAQRLTPGGMVSYITLTLMVAGAVAMLGGLFGQLQRGAGASQRVFELLDAQPDVADRPDAIDLPPIRGRVSFEEVSFSYNGSGPILNQVSFCAEPGEVIALVGPSGAGKTTVVNLLTRFYDVKAGRICVDEHDVREVTQHSLHSQIGAVPQETLLFAGSVADNIRYGKLDATPAEVEAAAQAANAHEFIMRELPDGYATLVGERGTKLSGGQRQRIAIARAILKDPRILVLDEATSSLDSESERLIQDALDRLMRGRTSFVIAHRLSTIVNADKIIVLLQGNMVEQGTHQELLERGGVYRRLHDFQFAFEDVTY